MNRDPDTQFDTWLDALAVSRSTAPRPSASDSITRDAQHMASQLHDLARHAERAPIDQSRLSSWEDFMNTHGTALPASPAISTGDHRQRQRAVAKTPAYRPAPSVQRPCINWNAIASATLVALIVATIGVGGWRVYGELGGSGGPNQPAHTPFGAFVQDDATPEPDPLGASIATAEECTVEPLTIDQVVQITYDPHAGTPGTALYQEIGEYPSPAYASDVALAGATSTFHMFEACIEANSYFQVWALLSPTLLQEYMLAILPPLTGEEEFRAILADLEANGQDHLTEPDAIYWPLFIGTSVSGPDVPEGRISRVVDQNIENTWMPTDTFLVTGYDSFYSDGSPTEMDTTSIYDSDLDGTPEPVVGYDPRLKQPSCFSIIFSWSEARDMWLVENPPVCG
jgi:hypothetical protein